MARKSIAVSPTEAGGPWLTGQVLIAMPALAGSTFARSVIYMCAHTADGAMGIVLNQPLANPSFADLLGTLGVAPLPPARSIRLHSGGPVDNGRGFVLHTDDWTAPDGSRSFGDGLAMTGTREALVAMLDPLTGPRRSVLLLGYAGWGEGQLEDELGDNVWLTADADTDLIFDPDYDAKWTRALAGIGVDPGQLSGQSGRA